MSNELIKTLEEIKEKIKTMSHYESADGQDLVMVADVGQCIDEYIDWHHYEVKKCFTTSHKDSIISSKGGGIICRQKR